MWAHEGCYLNMSQTIITEKTRVIVQGISKLWSNTDKYIYLLQDKHLELLTNNKWFKPTTNLRIIGVAALNLVNLIHNQSRQVINTQIDK